MIGERVDDWIIDAELGHNAQCRTYLAHGANDAKKQATIKVLAGNPQVQELFRGRLAALRKLEHPNIIAYVGGGLVHGEPYFVAEHVAGTDFEALLRDGKRPGWPEVLVIALQCVSALTSRAPARRVARRSKASQFDSSGRWPDETCRLRHRQAVRSRDSPARRQPAGDRGIYFARASRRQSAHQAKRLLFVGMPAVCLAHWPPAIHFEQSRRADSQALLRHAGAAHTLFARTTGRIRQLGNEVAGQGSSSSAWQRHAIARGIRARLVDHGVARQTRQAAGAAC